MSQKPKNRVELDKMRKAGELAAQTLDYITPHVQPGVSTERINQLVHDFITEHHAIPAPLNYRGFPKSVCTSINDVVCHGIPTEKEVLAEGDIVNIDVTVIVDEFHGDTSRMFYAGEVKDNARQLVESTYKAMWAGIETVKSGSKLIEVADAIEAEAKQHNYGVVREFTGHGIGKTFHDEPMVLHYNAGHPTQMKRLRSGQCFTIEPMLNEGTWQTKMLDDGWTAKTNDGKLSAQWEHTLAVTDDGYEVFTLSPAGYKLPPYG